MKEMTWSMIWDYGLSHNGDVKRPKKPTWKEACGYLLEQLFYTVFAIVGLAFVFFALYLLNSAKR